MDGTRRIFLFLVTFTTTATLCHASHAEPSKSTEPSAHQDDAPEQRLEQMDRMLASVDEAAARRSFWIAATSATLGAADVAAGAFAAGRGATVPAIVAFADSAFAFESAVAHFTLQRAPFHGIYQDFLVRRRSMDAATAIEETERAWQAEADSAHASRIRSGGILTSVGALVVAFSTTALVTNLGVPSKDASSKDRAAFDTVLLGLSGSLLVDGVATLVEPSPIESGWQSYRIMRAPVAAPRASFQLTPVRQGAFAGLTIRF
jgi:hypothetical protein